MTEDMKPVIKGWYSARLKSNLSPEQRKEKDITASFIDWVFFNGRDWEIPEYRELGFYVFNIIKLE